jgi:hypothetical protein
MIGGVGVGTGVGAGVGSGVDSVPIVVGLRGIVDDSDPSTGVKRLQPWKNKNNIINSNESNFLSFI